ncbi:MAG: BON domain-containing protein [Desulfobacteraceae bacterium]|nr:MAG: BON domain-containing protein [Desulfobacteraceae bacterium]
MAIVVISRQVGSLGDEIAASVAERMNLQLVDQASIHKLAQACDSEFEKACTLYETELEPGFFERFFFSNSGYTSLFESLNLELASRGNVVIIGRGAQIVLRDIPGVFKTRIVAPKEVRIKRITEQKGVSSGEAADFVDRYDAQRRALIRMIFDKDLKDWDLYDLILNTNNYSVKTGSEILCRAIELMPRAEEETLKIKLAKLAFAKKVESKIKKKVTASPYRNIEITAGDNGLITISGFVSDKRTKEIVGEIASEVDGVTKVENQLRTTGLSF